MVLHCALSYFNPTTLVGGGQKHSTMLHCPANGRMYIFGGDRSGFASDSDKANGFASDDFRNDIWSYDYATDNWRCEATWDVGDGEIHPWRPDWGMFVWDAKRKVFWFREGGSNGAFQGGGSFKYTGATGLRWNYGGGRLLPDPTMVAAGTLALPDNTSLTVTYDTAAHVVAINGTGMPLYDVVTAGGQIKSTTNRRPYWMTYGVYSDEAVDCRHYADPTHLVSFDPMTAKWSDPGLARAEDQIFSDTTLDGRVYVHEWRNACMVHDVGGDQLIWIAAASGPTTAVIHYSFAQNRWMRYTAGVPKTNLSQARYWFNEDDRKIYAIDPCGQFAPYTTTMVAWTYDVDAHTFSQPIAVPDCQSGPSLWTAGGVNAGQMVGGMQSFTTAMGDPTNGIIWFPEVTHPNLCRYGYQNDGRFIKMHAWHYQETPWRFETIVPPLPSNTQIVHGIITGFDPVNNVILTYGQNAGSTDKNSPLFPASNPVNSAPYMYCWAPSGFTKPTTGSRA